MTALLSQLLLPSGDRAVAIAIDGAQARFIVGATTTYNLAMRAATSGMSLLDVIERSGLGDAVDLRRALEEGRLLAPLDHPDPAHLHVTGTGLTHLGSAESRDRMHRELKQADLTDTMRMFQLGLEGGKPEPDCDGAQPEWFYKGDGHIIAAPQAALASPSFALDGGEEPELAALYVIAPDGAPCRLGFALGNEFSDHVTEKQNYLYLAHSKLRPCALGPELLIGALPASIEGASRIRRGGEIIWEKPFLTGEANMCHSIENLERHHFKYDLFRRPGDAHAHFLGTSTLSFADNIRTQSGDVFEIEAPPFTLPLRNRLEHRERPQQAVRVL
jgi:hypothetical protein